MNVYDSLISYFSSKKRQWNERPVWALMNGRFVCHQQIWQWNRPNAIISIKICIWIMANFSNIWLQCMYIQIKRAKWASTQYTKHLFTFSHKLTYSAITHSLPSYQPILCEENWSSFPQMLNANKSTKKPETLFRLIFPFLNFSWIGLKNICENDFEQQNFLARVWNKGFL